MQAGNRVGLSGGAANYNRDLRRKHQCDQHFERIAVFGGSVQSALPMTTMPDSVTV